MCRFSSLIFYAPHLLLYRRSHKRKVILINLYARAVSVESSPLGQLFDLSSAFNKNKYLRTLFYSCIGGLISKSLRFFYPRSDTFIIDTNPKISLGLKLANPYVTIFNAVPVGDSYYINHLVTIGEKNGRKPIIGNNVELYANCKVIGGITGGHNAVIGVGATVLKDVLLNDAAIGTRQD